jgi:deoxyribodipyrimidine photo-lyase
MSPNRARFQIEAVQDLRNRLKSQFGVDLVVRSGSPASELLKIASELNVNRVITSAESCSEELTVEREVKNAGLAIETVWDSTMIHLDDLPFNPRELPLIFTQFRKAVESNLHVRRVDTVSSIPKFECPGSFDVGQIPSVEDLCGEGITFEQDTRAVLPFTGGETAALARVQEYIWDRDCLKVYKETRNGMVGADYSSKFSAWLSQGSLSPRFV